MAGDVMCALAGFWPLEGLHACPVLALHPEMAEPPPQSAQTPSGAPICLYFLLLELVSEDSMSSPRGRQNSGFPSPRCAAHTSVTPRLDDPEPAVHSLSSLVLPELSFLALCLQKSMFLQCRTALHWALLSEI